MFEFLPVRLEQGLYRHTQHLVRVVRHRGEAPPAMWTVATGRDIAGKRGKALLP